MGYPRCLFLSGLRDYVTEEDLQEEFSHCGTIQKCTILYYPHNKKSTGMATILFERPADARHTKKLYTNKMVFGNFVSMQLESDGAYSIPAFNQLIAQV